MIAVGRATNSWRWTAARDQELIVIADVVHDFRSVDRELVKVQPDLTDVRVHFQHRQLTAARSVRRVRMVGIHEVGSVLACNSTAGGHDWKMKYSKIGYISFRLIPIGFACLKNERLVFFVLKNLYLFHQAKNHIYSKPLEKIRIQKL